MVIINKNLYQLSELLGIMVGDGCLSKTGRAHYIYISGHKIDDFEYHNKITRNLFLSLFNKEIKINYRKNENALFIRFSDKNIFYFFNYLEIPIGRKYNLIKIPSICKINKQFFYNLIRGLFDTDGCIIFSKQHKNFHYYPRLELTSKSKSLLFEILSNLEKLGFYGSISKKGNCFRLELPGFKNLDLWLKKIGFNNPKIHDKIKKWRPGPGSNRRPCG